MKKILLFVMVLAIALSCAACTSDEQENTANESIGNNFTIPKTNTYTVPENNIELGEIGKNFPDIEIESFEVADRDKLNSLTEAEMEAIAAKKADLLGKLTTAFKNAGINVDINEISGEVALDASVLFAGDSAVLSDNGKSFLNKFISAYASVVFNSEFEGFISKIQVEGHTAPLAGDTYEDGLPLSIERAETVKKYCLSSDAGIAKADANKLSNMMESVGHSNSRPIKDAKGNVDMAASRRVSFRFLINID